MLLSGFVRSVGLYEVIPDVAQALVPLNICNFTKKTSAVNNMFLMRSRRFKVICTTE